MEKSSSYSSLGIANIEALLLANLYLHNNTIFDQAEPETNHKSRITRRHKSITNIQTAWTIAMKSLILALLFVAISAYYVSAMDIRHAVVLLYLIVANVAGPYRILARYIQLDCFTHTCWMSILLCWLFDRYDFDMVSLLVFFFWEVAVFELMDYLGYRPENHEVVYFDPLPIFFTLYRESRGLHVRWYQ